MEGVTGQNKENGRHKMEGDNKSGDSGSMTAWSVTSAYSNFDGTLPFIKAHTTPVILPSATVDMCRPGRQEAVSECNIFMEGNELDFLVRTAGDKQPPHRPARVGVCKPDRQEVADECSIFMEENVPEFLVRTVDDKQSPHRDSRLRTMHSAY